MEPIKLECTYEERLSKKDNKPYRAVFIKFNDNYIKPVLISYPERVMIESAQKEIIKPSDFLQ